MNAAQRYLAASTARDVQAAVSELAESFAVPTFWESGPADQPALYGLMFDARVGDAKLSGVDLTSHLARPVLKARTERPAPTFA